MNSRAQFNLADNARNYSEGSMRKLIYMFCFSAALACAGNSHMDSSETAGTNSTGATGNTVPSMNITVKDGTNQVLGNALRISNSGVLLQNSSGYIYFVDWNANITNSYEFNVLENRPNYSAASCAGSFIIRAYPNETINGKSIFKDPINGGYFRPSTLDVNGNAVLSTSGAVASRATESASSTNMICQASATTLLYVSTTPITLTSAGIPTLTAPIQLSFN